MSAKRMLIIGGGSSGLVTLRTALSLLPDWEIICFEKSASIVGCWGRPYPNFVSTTTCYATQFAAMPEFDATMRPGDEQHSAQFFRGNEYGDYLERFADHFDLNAHIRRRHRVSNLVRCDSKNEWIVRYTDDRDDQNTLRCDAVVLCTGLVSKPKSINLPADSPITVDDDVRTVHQRINNQTVVVSGGGESAVDTATRLAEKSLGNRVFLLLRGGIRVSPRYHPIRGVPSDFLRNRLLLSIHPDLRNRLGDWFVRARIAMESSFRRWFPAQSISSTNPSETDSDTTSSQRRRAFRRRIWSMRLHRAAGEDLFDMFHNKSDDFLRCVADGTIRIVGPPVDSSWGEFQHFSIPSRSIRIDTDSIVSAIGFQSSIGDLFEENINLQEFYLGCTHKRYDTLFAVGFARPVIGNIPTISELQSYFVCDALAGRVARPRDIDTKTSEDWQRVAKRFTTMTDRLPYVYPVEMFPYCDQLAKRMGRFPTLRRVGSFRRWCRLRLSPATTLAYFTDDDRIADRLSKTKIYLPTMLIAILLLIKPVDWLFRSITAVRGNRG